MSTWVPGTEYWITFYCLLNTVLMYIPPAGTVLLEFWKILQIPVNLLGYGLTHPSDAQVVTGFKLVTRT